ncbi:hypothetical protein ASG51_14960 [Methylobacterium sp. Leaf465]|nr:hypothetical protein ASG51_14960 [Methylobacterium sp. Leaf465]
MEEAGTSRGPVAESDTILPLDLYEILRKAVSRVAGPLTTAAATEALRRRQRVDPPVIEPRRQDGDRSKPFRCFPRHSVTFVLPTTCHREDPITRGFGDAAWLAKPTIPWDVVSAHDEFAIGSV